MEKTQPKSFFLVFHKSSEMFYSVFAYKESPFVLDADKKKLPIQVLQVKDMDEHFLVEAIKASDIEVNPNSKEYVTSLIKKSHNALDFFWEHFDGRIESSDSIFIKGVIKDLNEWLNINEK